tara:strand:- start:4260 stop:5900 length:1641 start_codon:yes stop_codon:yes gene_type:complete
MGIPLYFKIISEKYPEIIRDDINSKDSLFLDLNCAIHPCCRKVMEDCGNIDSERLEKRMINEVLKYIEKLFLLVNPKLLFIAIDGVAPCAKMNQQRLRRYKTILDKNNVDKIKLEENMEISESWNTNAISPGTEFMSKLSKSIKHELSNNLCYKGIEIYFSDSTVPGEGEHKILDFIKTNDLQNDIVIYGLDADLIILSFVSHKNNIFLLREALEFGKPVLDRFLYLDIDNLKYFLVKDIQEKILIKDPTLVFTVEKLNSIIDDYIFISFLIGNDFLPHLLAFNLRENGLNILLDTYVELYVIYEQNLVNSKSINWDFLKVYFNELKNVEGDLLQKMWKKRQRFRLNRNYEDSYSQKMDLLNNYPILHLGSEKYIDIGHKNWKHRFYRKAMNIYDSDDLESCCLNYLEGLNWTYNYYFKGCKSWNYIYNNRHCPSLNDLISTMNKFNLKNTLKIKESKPYSHIVQLLAIFPKKSINLIPKDYRKLVNEDLMEYYPESFEIDTYYKRYMWQCEPILPLINFDKINRAVKKVKSNVNLEIGKIFTLGT